MKKYQYEFPMASLTSDVIVHATMGDFVLLIKRQDGEWALPGGFVNIGEGETFYSAAQRELREETQLEPESLEYFKTYGSPDRDPRGRVVTQVFAAKQSCPTKIKVSSDAEDYSWIRLANIEHTGELAFDHHRILTEYYYERVRK